MKRVLLATTALTLLCAGAQAETKWSGFYTGVNLGYAWADHELTDLDGYEALGATYDGSFDGLTAGIFAGINHRIDDFVLGIEIEAGVLTSDDDVYALGAVGPGPGPVEVFAYNDGGMYATAAARLGYLIEKTLVFVKAGVAGADTGVKIQDACQGPGGGGGGGEYGGETGFSAAALPVITNPLCNAETGYGGQNGLQGGWVLGIGVEHPIAEGWFARIEYNRIELGTDTFAVHASDGDTYLYDQDSSIDMLKIGVAWQFGTPE